MNSESLQSNPHASNVSHPMTTILVFAGVLAVLIGFGSIISHKRSGEEYQPTSKIPTLFERLFTTD